MTPELTEEFWEDLLILLDEGKVLPVIGSGVVTRGDDQSLFYSWLARRLADRLGIPPGSLPPQIDLNAVATAHLLNPGGGNALYNRGGGNALYTKIKGILDDECPSPGQALLDLASISAFSLYLTTTFDPLLQRALDIVRYGGASETKVLAYSTRQENHDLPFRRRDLSGTTVFHLLGRASASPDYVVWEEDMLEFMFSLNKDMPILKLLGRDLKDHGLLFLGLNFSDWLVRFFLRISRQEQLSKAHTNLTYFADEPGDFTSPSLVMFLGAVSRDIYVTQQNPVAFCAELARRWKKRHPTNPTETKRHLPPAAKEMTRGAIFVSYAREDEPAAAAIVRGLEKAGCTVWYDRQRLQAGQDWHNTLEDEVKKRCGLFLSVNSRTTEASRESYYRLERNWAANRAERIAHDEEFYIPVVVDDSPLELTKEPRRFEGIQATRLPGGEVTDSFGSRLLNLQHKAENAPQ